MGYPTKLMNLTALLAKAEATYGTAVAVTATADGHLLALSDRYNGVLTLGYLFDGDIGPSVGNLGPIKRVGSFGRYISGQIPMRAKGAGTTYAATVTPNIHTMLKISGFDATLSSGTYTYTPSVDGITYSSATMEFYKRGEKWTGRGALANWSFSTDGSKVPIHLFDVRAIADTVITDAAMITPTYPALSVAEPIAAGVTCSIGSFVTPVVRSASFNMNRNIETTRGDITSTDGHQGYVPNGYSPELKIVLESTALTYPTAAAGFDPYKMMLNAESNAVALTFGTVGSGYNNWKLNLPQAQLSGYTVNNDGPIATCELTFRAYNSSPIVQNDAVQVIWLA